MTRHIKVWHTADASVSVYFLFSFHPAACNLFFSFLLSSLNEGEKFKQFIYYFREIEPSCLVDIMYNWFKLRKGLNKTKISILIFLPFCPLLHLPFFQKVLLLYDVSSWHFILCLAPIDKSNSHTLWILLHVKEEFQAPRKGCHLLLGVVKLSIAQPQCFFHYFLMSVNAFLPPDSWTVCTDTAMSLWISGLSNQLDA